MMVAANDSKATEDVDYDFWGRMPGWTISEAAALLLDIDPDNIPTGGQSDVAPPGTREWDYYRLRRRLRRAQKMDDLDNPMRPTDFLEWAISNNLNVRDILKESVKSGKKLQNWRAKYFSMKRKRNALIARLEDNVSPKERTSLLKLVLGMARKSFNHKVDSPHTVTKIEKALQEANLSVSNDVIRKYLAEADEKFAE
jgi:hypothetical protein